MSKHVYARRIKKERTESGLYLPFDTVNKESVMRARVVQFGPDCDRTQVRRGDVIVFTQALVSEVDLGKKGWLFHIPMSAILCVEEP